MNDCEVGMVVVVALTAEQTVMQVAEMGAVGVLAGIGVKDQI